MITAKITFINHNRNTKVIKANCLGETEKLLRYRCFEVRPWDR